MPCLQGHMKEQFKNASSLIKCNTTQFACLFPLITFIQKYHFCHHIMINITYNPTINLFYVHAPPMGHCFNPFPTSPLDQQMSCHFADFHPSLINRFHLAGKLQICIWVYLIKKINYGRLTGQPYQLNTIEIQLMSTRFKLSFL